jgi:hypothetical protein
MYSSVSFSLVSEVVWLRMLSDSKVCFGPNGVALAGRLDE